MRPGLTRALGVAALAVAIALGGGATARANPAPNTGPDTGGTVFALPVPAKSTFT